MTDSFLPSAASTLRLLKSRRSVRRYTTDPVPDEFVAQLVEAGRWAPSASNRQPWHFVVIRDAAIRRQIAERATYHFIRWQHVADAALLIALCVDVSNPVYRRFAHQDIGLAGSHIMLQAHALGLGTCWTGAIDAEALGDILQAPNGVEVVGLLSVGFPAEAPEPRRRKPTTQVTHYDVFGNQSRKGHVTAGQVRGGLFSRLRRFIRANLQRR